MPSLHHDPTDLGSLILIRSISKERTIHSSFFLPNLRIWFWWLKQPLGALSKLASNLYSRLMAQRAGFLACLCDVRRTEYLLTLSCFPIHFKSQVNSHISSTYFVNFQGEGTSLKPLCSEDQAFVSLSKAFKLKESGNAEDDIYLT